MANRVTLKELRARVRAREEVRKVYVDNDDLDVWINDGIKELWDEILTVNQDFLVKISGNISIVSAQDSYPLPDDFADMLRVEGLYNGTTDWRPLRQFNLSERSNNNWSTPSVLSYRYRVMDNKLYLDQTPGTTGTLRLWYVPVPKTLSDDEDAIDFIFGWDLFVVLCCIEAHKEKEDDDTTALVRRKERVLERILSRAKSRNFGESDTIRDDEAERLLAFYPESRT